MYGKVLTDPVYLQKVARAALRVLHRLGVKDIVVTGASGLVPASVISSLDGVRISYIRKPTENSHGFSRKPGEDRPFVLLDDFIGTGATLRRMLEFVQRRPEAIILYSNNEMEKNVRPFRYKRWRIPVINIEDDIDE